MALRQQVKLSKHTPPSKKSTEQGCYRKEGQTKVLFTLLSIQQFMLISLWPIRQDILLQSEEKQTLAASRCVEIYCVPTLK